MWPDSTETRELLWKAEKGDPQAVEHLLGRHREALIKMVGLRMDRAILRRLDPSDIVQEVLVEAHRRLPGYLRNPVLPFHLWLRQIARDQLIDAHRRHRLARKRSIDREEPLAAPAFQDRSSAELACRLAAAGLTPAAAAMREELERRFQAVLLELKEEDREIILLRHFERLPNGEVAKALGLSEPAVSMRHLRALRRLRALLEGAGEGEER
jgi:RNA polymerase sigma-70 factor (ECF subfamily)